MMSCRKGVAAKLSLVGNFGRYDRTPVQALALRLHLLFVCVPGTAPTPVFDGIEQGDQSYKGRERKGEPAERPF